MFLLVFKRDLLTLITMLFQPTLSASFSQIIAHSVRTLAATLAHTTCTTSVQNVVGTRAARCTLRPQVHLTWREREKKKDRKREITIQGESHRIVKLDQKLEEIVAFGFCSIKICIVLLYIECHIHLPKWNQECVIMRWGGRKCSFSFNNTANRILFRLSASQLTRPNPTLLLIRLKLPGEYYVCI